MKLIKKIAAMLFAFAMVFSMTGVVQADETTDGSITINNAIERQTYTIYKILDLESYDGNNYSYKAESGWDEFITGAGKSYLKTNENGYVEFVGTDADMPAFAKSALQFAKDNGLKKVASKTADATNTVTFGTLSLGYYLIDSSTGALCSLDTTHPTATVQEKNSVPTVDKTILDSNYTTKKNSANIGDTVHFKTTIDVEKGAENYVLHDKMDAGLTFNSNISVSANQPSPIYGRDCILQTENLGDDCTFHLVFTQEYLNKLTDSHEIDVVYIATVNESAKINQANTNQTWLTYGDNKESNVDKTQTFSFGIPVFKYTGLTRTGLADAQFKLYNDEACKDEVKLTKADDHTYRVDPKGNATMVSPIEGKFNVNGLKAGTYYLKEMAAPKGYNKLANPITVTIDNEGKITVGNKTTTEVDVENKSGTLLPSTGGMGTTLIYLAGIVLVVLSGYVLISKRRASTK